MIKECPQTKENHPRGKLQSSEAEEEEKWQFSV
jgi:hypothetical protein